MRGRHKLPPRLYLDPKRQRWTIRFEQWCRRTPFGPDQKVEAEAILQKILGSKNWVRSVRQLKPVPKEYSTPPWARSETMGLVYFISSKIEHYPIKIGFCSGELAKRLGELQIGNPYRLEVLASDVAKFSQERRLHEKLAAFRLQGEWFMQTEMVMHAIGAAKKGQLLEWMDKFVPDLFRSETVPITEFCE